MLIIKGFQSHQTINFLDKDDGGTAITRHCNIDKSPYSNQLRQKYDTSEVLAQS